MKPKQANNGRDLDEADAKLNWQHYDEAVGAQRWLENFLGDVRVMSFEHIDDLRCGWPLIEAIVGPCFGEVNPSAKDHIREKDLRAKLHSLFRAYGWEGDPAR